MGNVPGGIGGEYVSLKTLIGENGNSSAMIKMTMTEDKGVNVSGIKAKRLVIKAFNCPGPLEGTCVKQYLSVSSF